MKKQIAGLLVTALLAAGLSLPAAAADSPAARASDDLNYSTAAQGGYVYTAIRGPLERIELATQKRATIVPQDKAYSLRDFSLQSGFLYWIGGSTIYKCKADGTGLTKLDAGGKASGLRAAGDSLYYLSKAGLWRMKTDGTARRQVAGDVEKFEPAGNFIYYTQSGSEQLFRCDKDGGNVTELTLLDGEWEPQVYGAAIYFPVGKSWYVTTADGRAKPGGSPSRIKTGYTVYKQRTGMDVQMQYHSYSTRVIENKTKKSFSLPDTDEFSWFGTNNYFYFRQRDKDVGLYRIGWDGKNKQKLADDGEPILLAGGNLVYRSGNDIAMLKD